MSPDQTVMASPEQYYNWLIRKSGIYYLPGCLLLVWSKNQSSVTQLLIDDIVATLVNSGVSLTIDIMPHTLVGHDIYFQKGLINLDRMTQNFANNAQIGPSCF